MHAFHFFVKNTQSYDFICKIFKELYLVLLTSYVMRQNLLGE